MVLAGASSAAAQQILLDKPVRAGELIVFPDLNDETKYYYVSDKPRLATRDGGAPQFSFLRYVENVRSGADQPEAREGEGGGIVHALVALSVTEDQIREAQRELQRLKPGGRIQGPVVYKSGKFGLVSSFADERGNLTTKVLGLGKAPILDGEKAAVSIQLTKLGAKILWESFKTSTPDISFTFEMDLEGFKSPHRAVIEAHFDQIYEHEAFAAGLASTYLAGEIKTAFDDLVRNGAIKVTQVGGDEKMEALITTAYNKLTEMIFSPVGGGSGTPSLNSITDAVGGQGSILDRATKMFTDNRDRADRLRKENREYNLERVKLLQQQSKQWTTCSQEAGGDDKRRCEEMQGWSDGRAKEVESGPKKELDKDEVSEPSLAIVAAYEMKKVRQRGDFKIDLNKYTSDTRTLRFDENIGDLRSLMSDSDHFRQVNLDDPLYRQREIVVFLDGLNAQDFGQYVNFVALQMRKRHAGGEETNDEVRIDRSNFNREGNNFKLLYGWKGDNDRRHWMDYEYKAVWSFFGGHTVEQPWVAASTGAIALVPPYQRRSVQLEADPKTIADAGVRSVGVKVFYKLGETIQVRQAMLSAVKQQLSDKIEFIAPPDQLDYEYEIDWHLTGNRSVSSGRHVTQGAILYVDELPSR